MYLSGSKNRKHSALHKTGELGILWTPKNRFRMDGVKVWAADNGCFTDTYPGDDEFMALLESLTPHRDRCLFVAAPDVVGDAKRTLALFPEMAQRIREAGWPVALVGQDGMESEEVDWTEVDWLFVGGSTEWKLGQGALDLCRQAKQHHVRIHVGRVNSWKRYRYSFEHLGAETVDGTFLAFGPDVNLPKVLSWMERQRNIERQQVMDFDTEEKMNTPDSPLDGHQQPRNH